MRELHWTDESEEHIWGHQVTPDEVEEVVNTRPRYTRAGRDDVEEVYGQTAAGRYLFVVLSEALDGRYYVVTARTMEQNERQRYQRRAH